MYDIFDLLGFCLHCEMWSSSFFEVFSGIRIRIWWLNITVFWMWQCAVLWLGATILVEHSASIMLAHSQWYPEDGNAVYLQNISVYCMYKTAYYQILVASTIHTDCDSIVMFNEKYSYLISKFCSCIIELNYIEVFMYNTLLLLFP